jgi:secernin
MDLVRLGLERARTARGAVDVVTDLIQRFGQGGKGWMHIPFGYSNGFLIADASEAWTLQSSSRRWAARRMADLGAISNHISIRADWDLRSDDAEPYAIERGWWSGDRGRLDFEAAYRSTRLFGAHGSEGRLRRSIALLEARRGRLGERDLFALLRDHGGPRVPQPAEKTEEAYFTICAHNDVQQDTTASMVVASDRRTRWFALAAPCTSPYVPLFLEGKVPDALTHAGEKSDERSAWWRFKQLQRAVEEDFAARLPRVREAFDRLEAEWLEQADPSDPTARMEEASSRALETCDRLLRAL